MWPYVRPLLECGELPVIHLQNSIEWHNEAIGHIHDAFHLYEAETYGYELLIREELSRVWFALVNHHQDILHTQSSENMDSSRLKAMIAFIQENYVNSISLADIAKSAVISERECLRCFKRTVGQPPMKYLLNHRVSVAAGLLMKTSMSITEICQQCGFESPSYFSMMFRKIMEATPKDYRSKTAVR